jgi:hypothetical protein
MFMGESIRVAALSSRDQEMTWLDRSEKTIARSMSPLSPTFSFYSHQKKLFEQFGYSLGAPVSF